MSAELPDVDRGALWTAIGDAADRAGIGIFIVQLDVTPPQVMYVNDWMLRLTRRTREDIRTRPPWATLDLADQARIREIMAKPDGPPATLQATIQLPDGSRLPVEVGSARIQTAQGLFSFGYLRDVSAEHRAVEALRQSEERFRFLVERAPDGVVILVEGAIVFINPTAIQLLGADPATVIGSAVLRYLPPQDAQLLMQRTGELVRTGAEMPPHEYAVVAEPTRTLEIKSVACEWEGGRAVLAFARDVTERKAIQSTLIAADRFAALGKLAAGIAHEINNPLAYVELSLELIERRLARLTVLDDIPELRTNLREARHGLARIGAVTADLRTFARTDDTPPGAVDLVAVVEQSLRMVDNDLRHRARLVRRFASESAPVIGNTSQLEQVFVNLLLNAIQALRDPTTDTITVAIQASHDADRKAHVVVSITDTGHGIPSSVLDRVFDPFFTTKPVGEGMGLGLSVCKNIIESLDGEIRIESEAAGTTVRVALRTFTRPGTPPPELASPAEPARREVVRRRVLIIDDEPLVRETLARLLSTDHEVALVDGGRAALAHLETTLPDVILCDVMMPDMDGMELHRRIALEHAGLERRVVFITGGAYTPELARFLAVTGNRCVAKPFKLDQLLVAIAEIGAPSVP